MEKRYIVVADSSETSRNKICMLLNRKGYMTYEATDGAGAIRISRSIFPDIVIVDLNLWGINAYEVADIIEGNKLSSVLFITGNPNRDFYEKLKGRNVYAYITKPINHEQLYNTVEFSIMNSEKIKKLSNKIEKLENIIESNKKIDMAKRLLIKILGVDENGAYNILRKRSMDECTPMDKIAEKVIKENM